MPNTNYKIVYSLKIHIALQAQGFQYVIEMKNPSNQRLNCWAYEETPEFLEAFDKLMEGTVKNNG